MSARPPSARTNLAGVINTGRVTAVSIAAYDYILTLPAEYRFYKAFYHNHFRLSTNLVLFVLIRYISILTIALGCIGFWGTFTPEACRRYYLLPTLARVVQSMVSQAILGLRAYGISRKNSTVGIVLLSSYILATAVQWFANAYHRVPVNVGGSCGAATIQPSRFLSAWLFYLAGMLYDLLTLSISMAYLFKYHSSSPFASRLVRMMVYDGLGYFVVLTVVNTVNAILFRIRNSLLQVAGAPLGGAFTWIMSQRILIHLQDAASKRPRSTPPPVIRPPDPNLNAQGAVGPRPHGPDKDTDSSFMGSSCVSSEPVQSHGERPVVVGVALRSASCDESSLAPTVKRNEGLVSR